ncbi:MAG TPA: type II TA system antitoxin MqsA family protein [Coriobacteriia bacterium]|nr:type II TA system antitoxin MqsA family protein [Coriobacteriia bacterium]
MEWINLTGSECPVCGQRAIVVTSEPIEESAGGRAYLIEGVARSRCTACGEEFFTGRQCEEIATRVTALARADLGRLSSEEIHELRLELGLTQADLEEQLGVGTGTVGRWERGTVLQGGTADRLMRIIRGHPELLPELGYVAREGRGPYRKRSR